MSPEEFKRVWTSITDDKLIAYRYEEMANCTLKKDTKDFLAIAGLPDECSPNLFFHEKLSSLNLISLKESLLLERDDLIYHYLIGISDNTSICIDANDEDKIVIIDIEYPAEIDAGMKGRIPIQLMNSSVGQLAECLLVYLQFWLDIQKEKKGGTFSSESTEARTAYLQSMMYKIDPPCMDEEAFWPAQTDERALFGN